MNCNENRAAIYIHVRIWKKKKTKLARQWTQDVATVVFIIIIWLYSVTQRYTTVICTCI